MSMKKSDLHNLLNLLKLKTSGFLLLLLLLLLLLNL
ncbi:unnamed protein product [Brassica oleracea var. botrytis]